MEESEKIRKFIVDNFLFGDGSSLNDDTSFLEERIIDSTGILQIISYIEEEFDIKIDDEEIIPENLDSLNNIAVFLNRKLSSG
ncbi:MAG TPA: acyl carrier protein [Syntrophales bacterium]|nr:acyl carrier protein [Syntrophales bacterium]